MKFFLLNRKDNNVPGETQPKTIIKELRIFINKAGNIFEELFGDHRRLR